MRTHEDPSRASAIQLEPAPTTERRPSRLPHLSSSGDQFGVRLCPTLLLPDMGSAPGVISGEYTCEHEGRCRPLPSSATCSSPISRLAALAGLRPRLPLSSELRFGMNSGVTLVRTMWPQRRLPIA